MATEPEYVCALSGIVAKEEDLVLDAGDDDALGELPLGWTRVVFFTRQLNPEWEALRYVQQALYDAQISDIPADATPDVRSKRERMARLIARNSLYAVEERTPRYIVEEESVCFAPVGTSMELADAVKKLREMLGLSVAQ